MRWTFSAAVVVGVFALGTVTLAKDPPPPDVKCDTPEWAPFRDAVASFCKTKKTDACKEVVAFFKKCTGNSIEGARIAKGKFDYMAESNPSVSYWVRFAKAKNGWKVTKVWQKDTGKTEMED